MRRTKLGKQGLKASAQGLGCMGMTWAYGGGGLTSRRRLVEATVLQKGAWRGGRQVRARICTSQIEKLAPVTGRRSRCSLLHVP
jgi:hypothetical protein